MRAGSLKGTGPCGSRRAWLQRSAVAVASLGACAGWAQGVAPIWRATAQRVAQAGVPLDALAPNAPDSHTVRPGDTLWDLSRLFLRSPWRWPELWGMNLDEVRNPHLIYPGQVLQLVREGGRAFLRMGARGPVPTVKLSPRARVEPLEAAAVASIPMHLIGPFLNEAVVLDTAALAAAPRIVAARDGRVMVAEGETAYVRGDLGGLRRFTVYRTPKALADPTTREVLGYEAAYVGAADLTRTGLEAHEAPGGVAVPASVVISASRQEAGIGDRLSPMPVQEPDGYVPHAPSAALDGRVVSIYGEALSAGQNQIVALNRGRQDGLQRGHVLALWRAGARATDTTVAARRAEAIRLPDERHGLLFVFRVFERVSYALIVSALEPVRVGDRFTEPSQT